MKSNIRFNFISAAFVLILLCAGGVSAQTDEPMAGGYGNVSKTDKEVLLAARFAVRRQAGKQRATIRLISINKAESQVVAGLNYRFCLKVEIKKRGRKTKTVRTVETVVFQDLEQKLSLESWQETKCGGKR